MSRPPHSSLAAFVALALLAPGCASGPERAAKDHGGVVSRDLIKTTRSWDGTLLPAYPRGQPEINIKRIVIPPGIRLPIHLHPVINAGVLLRGELTVVKENGQTLQLHAGDPIVELVDAWHYGVNRGKVPAEIIVVYAGTQGTPTTVIQSDHAAMASWAGTWSAPSLSRPNEPIRIGLAADGTATEQVDTYRGTGQWKMDGKDAVIRWASGWAGLLRADGRGGYELLTWKKSPPGKSPPDDRQPAQRLR